MRYKFKFDLNDHDYYEFNKHHLLHAPDMKKRTFWMKLYVPVLLSLILIFHILQGDDFDLICTAGISFFIVSAIWIFSLRYLLLILLKLRIRFMKKSGKMPYSSNVSMYFFDDYFTEITSDTKTDIKYTAVMRAYISELNAIYIYSNIIQAYIIPYSAFQSPAECEKFWEFITEKVNIKHTVGNA